MPNVLYELAGWEANKPEEFSPVSSILSLGVLSIGK
jgi:hypothetical protein